MGRPSNGRITRGKRKKGKEGNVSTDTFSSHGDEGAQEEKGKGCAFRAESRSAE